jgi:hypothetical protein
MNTPATPAPLVIDEAYLDKEISTLSAQIAQTKSALDVTAQRHANLSGSLAYCRTLKGVLSKAKAAGAAALPSVASSPASPDAAPGAGGPA